MKYRETVGSGGVCGQGCEQAQTNTPFVATPQLQRELFRYMQAVDGLIGPLDVSSELWREYQQADGSIYRIWHPVALYRRDGGTTHRIVDVYGVVHAVPCGSLHPNVIIRWQNHDVFNPVNW
jgi:hypothetical protein